LKKKAIRKTEICKKQANFNCNKPKNKQPQAFKKTRNSRKKQAQIRKKTARLATLTETIPTTSQGKLSPNWHMALPKSCFITTNNKPVRFLLGGNVTTHLTSVVSSPLMTTWNP